MPIFFNSYSLPPQNKTYLASNNKKIIKHTKGKKKTTVFNKTIIRTRLRYDKDVRMIKQGMENGYDQYVKGSKKRRTKCQRTDV